VVVVNILAPVIVYLLSQSALVSYLGEDSYLVLRGIIE
jgi:ribosomal protein L11 methylase PrmA